MMVRPALIFVTIAALAPLCGSASGRDSFASSVEPPPVLITLYEAADSRCRLARIDSVEVEVACVSRSIYGAALNDKNWCIGIEGQANAYMEWHECVEESLRFPPLDLPGL